MRVHELVIVSGCESCGRSTPTRTRATSLPVLLITRATPGHTSDHHAYVLTEHGVPVALFSGGSLMVDAIGRSDLCGPKMAQPLAHEMFRSLPRTSTIGQERVDSPLFSIHGESRFVEQLVAGFGTFPRYFSRVPAGHALEAGR